MRFATLVLAALVALGCGRRPGAIADTAPAGTQAPRAERRSCPATRVHGDHVHAGPFAGIITRPYDVHAGRFRLRVGGMRGGTLSQKIPWFVAQRHQVGDTLRITGRRRDGRVTFRASLARADPLGEPRRWVFPSNLDPPSAGCWRLSFRSETVRGALWVRVIRARAR